jgi:hypothetical protein
VGELEQACATALQALEIGQSLKSERPKAYIREFRARLLPHRQQEHVRAFAQQVADDPLWRSSRGTSRTSAASPAEVAAFLQPPSGPPPVDHSDPRET